MLITPIFYITGALLSGAIAIGTYFSYKKSKNQGLKYLFLSFVFLSLHSFSLSLPTFIFPGNHQIIGYGFIIGMVFLFLLLLSSLQVETSLKRGFMERHSFIISTIIIGVGITSITILLYDFRLPIISSRGAIFWNINTIIAWLIGTTCLIYGLIWSDFFQQEKRVVSSDDSKLKMSILSIDGIMLGVSALLVFTSANELETIIGHSLFIVACVLTLISIILPSKK